MSTTSTCCTVVSLAAASTDALVREGDQMEVALGHWLTERVAQIADRVHGRRAVDGRPPLCSPITWRALMLLWASSPDARARFSEEARGGLTMALTSMDDRALLSLARGILDDAQRVPLKPAA